MCNNFILQGITFIQNINFHIKFFVFVILVLDVVALPPVALKSVYRARDGLKCACKVDGCDASYMAKYNLVRHLSMHHNVVMDSSKFKCPSIQKEGPRHQNHATMNVQVLSNLLA